MYHHSRLPAIGPTTRSPDEGAPFNLPPWCLLGRSNAGFGQADDRKIGGIAAIDQPARIH